MPVIRTVSGSSPRVGTAIVEPTLSPRAFAVSSVTAASTSVAVVVTSPWTVGQAPSRSVAWDGRAEGVAYVSLGSSP